MLPECTPEGLSFQTLNSIASKTDNFKHTLINTTLKRERKGFEVTPLTLKS
jgi:hypothetical protein